MNVIGVDVGTTSVRVAIISFQGDKLNEVSVLGNHKLDINHLQHEYMFEQNSTEIWKAICECSKECLRKSQIKPNSIKSIAFSATCSLVIHKDTKHESENDIIMWMDHRALNEAQAVSEKDSSVLRQFGGTCSPEFSLAKLLWLQTHDPTRIKTASGLFELPDWLVFRCAGGDPKTFPRSLCSVTCKWGYNVELQAHCKLINSKPLADKIGQTVLRPGSVSGYLSSSSARELGLSQETNENLSELKIAVGTSLIDAHSGMLAMLSIPLKLHVSEQSVESTLCSLAGTSSCHLLLTKKYNFTRGIWGPYKDVVLQDYYLLEAGQSLTGKLIEICIENHDEGKKLLEGGKTIHKIINELNELLKVKGRFDVDLHVLPTFHGNRSPIGNPRLRGGVYGLTSKGPICLLDYYVAVVESLTYETKFITESLQVDLKNFLVSGGLMKNRFYMQTLADVLQCRVITTSLKDVDFMVMGSGLIARQAALYDTGNAHADVLTQESMRDIRYHQLDLVYYEPNKDRSCYHDKKYRCYREFVDYSLKVDEILQTA